MHQWPNICSQTPRKHCSILLMAFAFFLHPKSFADTAISQGVAIKAKDLALILPARGNQRFPNTNMLFPKAWWKEIHAAFAKTSVGDAFQEENSLDDWQLVAVRFAPCQPLLAYVSKRNDVLCQPELRLIWQAVQQRYVGDHWRAYADDRAIHALYRFDGEQELGSEQAKTWYGLLKRAELLNKQEEGRYEELDRSLVASLLNNLVGLRTLGQDRLYDELGERPEFDDREQADQFLLRLKGFLERYAKPDHLTQLTAFSLPEGRDPPMIDEWVFLAFEPLQNGQSLQAQPLTVRSRRDGRILADYGFKARGSARRDDEVLQAMFEGKEGPDHQELSDAIIWTFGDRKLKREQLADPHQTHVAHTSCISCHKLGPLAFDLHNLSYLEDRPISISPRVVQDVERELKWLARD